VKICCNVCCEHSTRSGGLCPSGSAQGPRYRVGSAPSHKPPHPYPPAHNHCTTSLLNRTTSIIFFSSTTTSSSSAPFPRPPRPAPRAPPPAPLEPRTSRLLHRCSSSVYVSDAVGENRFPPKNLPPPSLNPTGSRIVQRIINHNCTPSFLVL
jgi:hypothetical protein